MDFVDAADRSTSTQHEIIALFSSSSSSQSSSGQIYQLDGRTFHPVSQHEGMDDILTTADPEWDVHMELEPIPWASTQCPDQGMDESRISSTSSHKDTQVTDGESSVSSFVPSNIFNDASIDNDTDTSPISFPDCISQYGRKTEHSQWQHQKLLRQVTEPPLAHVASQTTVTNGDQRQSVFEYCDQTLPTAVAGQDQRFKPFHEEKWNQRYKELLVFHSQHGHVAVPHTYPPNQQLARWIKR